MGNYRHIVRLPYTTGIPEDVSVNVFHSISDDLVEAEGFADKLITFYGAVDSFFSALLSTSTNAASVTTYDMSDPLPRIPVNTKTFTLTTGALTLPPEVAICLSFQGIKISGQPQSRRRGRVYLGPLSDNAQDTGGRPTSTVISTSQAAATALAATPTPGVAGIWAIYSPTDAQTVPVDNGWIDNEFDTVRSRGRRAVTRNTWT